MSAALALEVGPLARMFRALGEPTRLRIVALLAHGELCVCHLESALGLSQPTASRHLGVLRAAGVVGARRAGSWIHYRLAAQADPAARRQLRALMRAFRLELLVGRAARRLVRSKGPRACR